MEVQFTQEQLQQLAPALAGKPGELTFNLSITRADGRVEEVQLVGRVDGGPAETCKEN